MSDPDSKAEQSNLTAIERSYREGNNELPPTDLDAAVLAHAHAHAKGFRSASIWTSPRWIMGLATAAAIMLTVSVYRNIELEADLAATLSQQGSPSDQPGRGDPTSESVSTPDSSSLRGSADHAAPTNSGEMPPSPVMVKPPSASAGSTEREARQAASPKRLNSKATIAISPTLESDSEATATDKFRSQLGQKSASVGSVLQDSAVSSDAARASEPLLEARSTSQPDQHTCLIQFSFPEESREHVVKGDWVSYRLNGNLHVWRCREKLWEEVPPDSEQ
jgi:hypothetical protein